MITDLKIEHFRNYRQEKVSFKKGINVFLGKNGQGKTNLLEAVYVLGMLSSFRKTEAESLIREGESSFSIEGFFADDEASVLAVEKGLKGWKKIETDGCECVKKSDYIGRIKMVVFSPDEMELIQGSPDVRRKYLDRTYFHVTRSHLKNLKLYKRILTQRNLLLKRGLFKVQELDIWSERLAHAGAKVVEGRYDLVNIINRKLEIEQPFAKRDKISLNYLEKGKSDIRKKDEPGERLLDKLYRVRAEEIARKMTLVGPHRDDVEITINGEKARSFSSRGEMRSILLALKAAEVEIFRNVSSVKPLVMLDDVASELDIDRRRSLLDYLRHKGEQVLITTTEAENLPLMDREKRNIFKVHEGKILH
ncbi:MAG: DNA replication/repair protein RecF [Deltaproteobacteria bacterium]|nr:DNA replication/repair protein RecF [Deltaproteobacteria bacterium]